MITAKIIGTEEVINRIDKLGPSLRAELKTFQTAFAINTVGYVRGSKLSGQVLQHRRGRLKDSINYRVEDTGDKIASIIGTNVEYAAIHEYGFHGPESVKEHLRMMTQAWGRPVKEPRKINISAHTRTMNMPERSFLRSTLADKKEEFRQGLMRTTAKVINQ